MRTAGICSNKKQDYNSFWMLEYDVYEIKIGLIFKSNIKFNKDAEYRKYSNKSNIKKGKIKHTCIWKQYEQYYSLRY